MNENDQRQFDALHKLSEQSWRDWDHKTRHEWRLSFGIWGALLASCALATKVTVGVSIVALIPVGVVVLSVHVFYQRWLQRALNQYRRQDHEYQGKMCRLVGLEVRELSQRAWWRHPALWTQTTITALLVLVAILIWLSSRAPV